MALGKGIPVINGFDLNSKLPLDSRAVADTMEEMNKLITDGSVGDGQLCYCKADKKMYVLKDNAWSEVGGGGGGGKSVPPTLNLIDFNNGEVKTSVTEEEKNNLNNGLYNQVVCVPDTNNTWDGFGPSKLIKVADNTFYIFQFHITGDMGTGIFNYSSISWYSMTIGEKNTSNEYPLTIEKSLDINPLTSGGDNTIPTLETKRSYIGDDNTVYSDADIELIKKQENNFINLPAGDDNNVMNTLCFVVKNKTDSSGNSYILTAVGGWAVAFTSLFSSTSTFIMWDANITTKKLTMHQFTSLSHDETSLYVRDGKIFLTDTLTTHDIVNVLHNSYTFDTINGKPIIHSDSAVNRYNIPTITFED